MRIFSFIFSSLNLILLVVQFYYGYLEIGNYVIRGYHQIIGIFIATSVALNHAIVMFFFIGTGKYIKEVTLKLKRSGDIMNKTHRFKRHLFPFCFFSIITTILTAITGAAANMVGTNPKIHLIFAISAIILNFVSIPLIWIYTSKNKILLHEVEKIVNEKNRSN